MPTGTGDSAVAALDGKIYIFGGSTFRPHILPTSSDMGSGTWGSTVNYEYDPKTDRWRERAPLPIGLSHPGAVGLNGKLYVLVVLPISFMRTRRSSPWHTTQRQISGRNWLP
jgi:N-acetylneuraminic acid mutarotase